METTTRRKKVLCPMEKNGKTFWMRIGTAFANADGSTNVYLDAYPTNGKLQIRELDEKDLQRSRADGRANGYGEGRSNGYSERGPEPEQLPF